MVVLYIERWLKTPAQEEDGTLVERTSGTPQGGVASPLLANIYMNRFLKYWRLTGCGKAFRAHVIAYADDFVILSRGHAVEAMMWTKAVMTKLGLILNEAKTSIRDARKERFEFLGYSFGPHYWWKNGQRYLGASPSKKSVQRIRTKISALLVPGNNGSWPEVRDQLNRLLSGWSAYFSYGTRVPAYRAVDAHVYDRVDRAAIHDEVRAEVLDVEKHRLLGCHGRGTAGHRPSVRPREHPRRSREAGGDQGVQGRPSLREERADQERAGHAGVAETAGHFKPRQGTPRQ